MSFVLLVVHI